MDKKITISVCMGSSCFTRGNNKSIEIIKNYIETNNLEDKIILKGNLCEEVCSKGPNICINDKVFNKVKPENVIDMIKDYFI